jgi:hypothetical protein
MFHFFFSDLIGSSSPKKTDVLEYSWSLPWRLAVRASPAARHKQMLSNRLRPPGRKIRLASPPAARCIVIGASAARKLGAYLRLECVVVSAHVSTGPAW